MLYSFVDIFCFVYHDTSDIENIAQNLSSWVKTYTSTEPLVLPEILIILTKKGVQKARGSEEFLTNLAHSCPDLVPKHLSDLRFITIKKDDLTTTKSRSRLHRHILKALDKMRHKRVDRDLLFSTSHFIALSKTAFNHLLSKELWDFIKASRLLNPITTDLVQYLINFVNQVQSA